MKKTKLLTLLVVVLGILNLVLLAFLFSGTKHGSHQRPKIKQQVIKRLNFDDEQTVAYEALIAAHHEAMHSIHMEKRQLKQALYDLIGTERHAEQDSIKMALRELNVHEEDVHLNHFEAIRELCRPEQLEEFKRFQLEITSIFKGPPPPRKHKGRDQETH